MCVKAGQTQQERAEGGWEEEAESESGLDPLTVNVRRWQRWSLNAKKCQQLESQSQIMAKANLKL